MTPRPFPPPRAQARIKLMPMLMGKAAGAITSIEPAAKIIDDMVIGARDCINRGHSLQARL